jgi:hypothetical protein
MGSAPDAKWKWHGDRARGRCAAALLSRAAILRARMGLRRLDVHISMADRQRHRRSTTSVAVR